MCWLLFVVVVVESIFLFRVLLLVGQSTIKNRGAKRKAPEAPSTRTTHLFSSSSYSSPLLDTSCQRTNSWKGTRIARVHLTHAFLNEKNVIYTATCGAPALSQGRLPRGKTQNHRDAKPLSRLIFSLLSTRVSRQPFMCLF